MTVLEEFEIDEPGYFWWRDEIYPDDSFAPEKGVNGYLKIKKNGEITLELDGVLPHEGTNHPLHRILGRRGQSEPTRAIQGLLKRSGKKVILVDPVANGGQVNSSRFSWERYIATMCLVGTVDFPKNSHVPSISEMEVSLTGYESWLLHGTLKHVSTENSLQLTVEEYEGPVYETANGKLAFSKGTHVDGLSGLHSYKASIEERMFLTISKEHGFTAGTVRDEFVALQDLLLLLTGSSYQLRWPEVIVQETQKQYTLMFRRIDGLAKPLEVHEVPLKFDSIKDKFGAIYETWMEKRKVYGPGFFYFFATRRDAKLYVESQFLLLVQGLEAFHRVQHEGKEPSAAIVAKLARIMGDVQKSKDKRWLETQLRHALEPSLPERLIELFTSLPLDHDHELLKGFATKCAHLRNDLSHFGGKATRTESAKFLRETMLRNEVVGYLYHMLLLQEVGLSREEITPWAAASFGGMRYRQHLESAGFFVANTPSS